MPAKRDARPRSWSAGCGPARSALPLRPGPSPPTRSCPTLPRQTRPSPPPSTFSHPPSPTRLPTLPLPVAAFPSVPRKSARFAAHALLPPLAHASGLYENPQSLVGVHSAPPPQQPALPALMTLSHPLLAPSPRAWAAGSVFVTHTGGALKDTRPGRSPPTHLRTTVTVRVLPPPPRPRPRAPFPPAGDVRRARLRPAAPSSLPPPPRWMQSWHPSARQLTIVTARRCCTRCADC